MTRVRERRVAVGVAGVGSGVSESESLSLTDALDSTRNRIKLRQTDALRTLQTLRTQATAGEYFPSSTRKIGSDAACPRRVNRVIE